MSYQRSNGGFTLTELLVTLVTSMLLVGLVYLFYLFIFKFNANFTNNIFGKKEQLLNVLQVEKTLKNADVVKFEKSGEFVVAGKADTLVKQDTLLLYNSEQFEKLNFRTITVTLDNGETLVLVKNDYRKIPINIFQFGSDIKTSEIREISLTFSDGFREIPLYYNNEKESIKGFTNK